MKKNLIYKLIAVFLALLLWQVLAIVIKQPILIVTPLSVIKRLGTIWLEAGFWSSIGFSMLRILVGFFAGLILGILFAIVSSKSKLAEALLWPYMVTVRSVPVASIVVICLIWLSSANLSAFISFLIVIPVIYQNVLTGIRSKDKELEEAAMVSGATGFQRFRYVTLPQIAPHLLSACTVTVGMAWKAGIAAEIIGTPKGSIGQQLYLSKIYLDTDDLLAWTVVLVILSIICEKLIVAGIKLLISKLSLESKNQIGQN
ncbi:MAG: ABC transporter permease subunit [Lachnospiraceae bacterium]|nr:ABC transporter permease subunit [Lachnospiraceae bacterium]